MATIVEKVQNLISGIAAVKAAFKTALTDKGVTVADELKLKDYPPLINDIQVESGEEIIAELNIVTTEEEPTNPVEGLIWIYESGAPDTLEPDIGGNEGDNSDSGGDSNGGEDTPSVTYLYTVSGASNASANGDYYDTGETFNDVATYTNGSCYIFFDTGNGLWYLSEHKNNTTNAPLYTCSNSTATPTVPTSGWSDGITVSVYGGGGSSDGGNGALFRVSGAGSTEANGDYFDTGETRNNLPIYKNENNIYMYFSTQCGDSWSNGWCLSPTVIDEGSGMLYCTVASDADTYPTNMLSSWSTLDGVSPTPICRELDENGNEIIPADYTVSGAGTEAVNGDYYATGNYISETNGAIYKHATNEVYLFGNGSNCFFAFEAVYSPAYYYTCETYSYDIQTGDWANAIYPSTGSGSTPYPTVTKN